MDVTFQTASVYVQHHLNYYACNLCGACMIAGPWDERDRLRDLHAEWHRGISPSK